MGDKTGIEWTATVNADGTITPGATWNPVTGCSKISPGCAHCYAEKVADRFWPTQYAPVMDVDSGRDRPRVFSDVLTHWDRLDQPLRWKRPRKVFVNSMSDLFHEDVPDAFIERVFSVMGLAERHVFQVLTKRPERMLAWFRARRFDVKAAAILQSESGVCHYALPWPLPNVWLGVSVENQHFADERIPLLLQTAAAVRFISAEPLLGPLNLGTYGWLAGCDACCNGDRCPGPPECTRFDRRSCPVCRGTANGPNLDWVIVGGESGPGARPCAIEWIESIVKQCRAAGVPPFVKQLGARPVFSTPACVTSSSYCAQGHALPLRDRKGGDIAEWPDDLRVREMPAGAR